MAELNYQVDSLKRPTMEVVREFLSELGLNTTTQRSGKADIIIGSKNFTEQYLLAEMMAVVIENYTSLDVDLKTGLAGTKIAFDALQQGEIDLYPEYTGTGLLAILQTEPEILDRLLPDKDQVFNYVQQQTAQKYDLNWLTPFGFNNSYALMMRNEDIERLGINSISELKDYLSNRQ